MCKLTKMNVLESLPKPLKFSKDIESRKLFIFYFQKNEYNSRRDIWSHRKFLIDRKQLIESQRKPPLVPEILKNNKFWILGIRISKSNLCMGL